MFIGIAILGAIFIVITTFSVINASRRGESKRGPIISLVVALLITAGAITQLPFKSATSKPNQTVQSAKQSTVSATSGQAFSSSDKTATRAENEQAIQKQLAKSLKKLGPVTFDHKTRTYTLTITNKNLKKTIKALKKEPSLAKQAKWPKFVNNFIQTSQSLKKALGSGYRIVMRVGKQSPVLIYKDGYVTKNEFE